MTAAGKVPQCLAPKVDVNFAQQVAQKLGVDVPKCATVTPDANGYGIVFASEQDGARDTVEISPGGLVYRTHLLYGTERKPGYHGGDQQYAHRLLGAVSIEKLDVARKMILNRTKP